MEGQIYEENEDFTLHRLNDDCLLKVFEYLSFEDIKSLGKTSARFKNLSMIRCHKFTFEFRTMLREENGDKLVDDILLEYGEHIRSWSLTMYDEDFISIEKILRKVGVYCKNLKILELNEFRTGPGFVPNCQEAIDCLDNVEVLSFVNCNMRNHSDLLQRFRKLKHLRTFRSLYNRRDLQIMLRNNPDMESIVFDVDKSYGNCISDLNLCEFGPKFEKLCLYSPWHAVQMDLLLRLAATNLTKLKLALYTINLDVFLTEMSKKGILKELELWNLPLNSSAFNKLRSFENLELLVIGFTDSRRFRVTPFDSTLIWPRHLKHLLLNVPITEDGFISIIRQLKYLTRFYWERDLQISDLHGKLESIVKECHSRPTLNISIKYKMTYIVNYEARAVSFFKEIIKEYIEIDFREQQYFSKAITH